MKTGHASAVLMLTDLTEATQRLDHLLDHSVTGEQAAELSSVRDAVLRAYRTIDTQDVAVRELTDSVRTLARRLLESHARFAEWMLSGADPRSGDAPR